MPLWLAAGGAGLLAGSALLLGSLVAWFVDVPRRVVAVVMSFGAGVLISALSFELVQEAVDQGGVGATVLGFAVGACAFVGLNVLLARAGARHRKRSGHQQPAADEVPEAFEEASLYSGLIASIGFLVAFSLHSLG